MTNASHYTIKPRTLEYPDNNHYLGDMEYVHTKCGTVLILTKVVSAQTLIDSAARHAITCRFHAKDVKKKA